MEKLNRLVSRAVPVMMPNIDTDIITPMNRLTATSTGRSIGYYAFEPLRYIDGDGDTGAPDPDFPLNDPFYAGAQIMICGENFGCGSSRESAPAAIAELGFRCLVGTGFGDIFFNNCFQQGLLPIVLASVDGLLSECTAGGDFLLDLNAQTLTTPSGTTLAFEVNALKKEGLLHGLDDLGLMLDRQDQIDAFEARDRQERPWIYPGPSS